MDIISVDWRDLAALSRAFIPLLEPPYLTFHRVYNDSFYPRHLYQEKNTSSSLSLQEWFVWKKIIFDWSSNNRRWTVGIPPCYVIYRYALLWKYDRYCYFSNIGVGGYVVICKVGYTKVQPYIRKKGIRYFSSTTPQHRRGSLTEQCRGGIARGWSAA